MDRTTHAAAMHCSVGKLQCWGEDDRNSPSHRRHSESKGDMRKARLGKVIARGFGTTQAVWILLVAIMGFLPCIAGERSSPSFQLPGSRSTSLYRQLGVSRGASATEIRSAYLKLALRWHPDKNPGQTEQAEARFKELRVAYEVLADPSARAWYDSVLGSSPVSQPQCPSDDSDAERAEEDEAMEEAYAAVAAELSALRREVSERQQAMAEKLARLRRVCREAINRPSSASSSASFSSPMGRHARGAATGAAE